MSTAEDIVTLAEAYLKNREEMKRTNPRAHAPVQGYMGLLRGSKIPSIYSGARVVVKIHESTPMGGNSRHGSRNYEVWNYAFYPNRVEMTHRPSTSDGGQLPQIDDGRERKSTPSEDKLQDLLSLLTRSIPSL